MKKHNIFKALLTSLLALVLVAGTFATGVKAADEPAPAITYATVTYDANADTITFSSATEGAEFYYAVVKNTDEIELAGSKFKKADSATLTLDKEGLKIAENKKLVLVALDKKPADEKAKYTPNFTVEATSYKKTTVNVNYAAATDACAISSVVLTPSEKGADPVVADLTKVYYSSDEGKTWTAVKTAEAISFTGAKLATFTAEKKGAKLLFKVTGTVAADAVDETPAVPNARGTKAVSVSIKAAKELKSVKVDFAKGTIAIKNGMDYAVVKTGAEVTESDWKTVLPVNKKGTANDGSADKKPITEIAATDYVAEKFAKDASNADKFTATKVSALYLADLLNVVSADAEATGVDVYVRTSAGVGKAQSSVVKATILKPAAAPTITNKEGVIAEANEKKVVEAPEITGATNDTFEYIIVDDVENVNLVASKWTKLAAGTKINVEKAKSKVVRPDGTTATVEIKTAGVKILVRAAAVKTKGETVGKLASNYVSTELKHTDAKEATETDPAVEAKDEWILTPTT